jgi:hypothetical protein
MDVPQQINDGTIRHGFKALGSSISGRRRELGATGQQDQRDQ